MVEEMAEESVKKQSDFRFSVEGWSTDLEGEAELRDDTPPPSKKSAYPFLSPNVLAFVHFKCD